MKRSTLVLLLIALVLGACGGGVHGQRVYHTRYGVQAHSSTFGLPPKNPALRPTALPPTTTATILMLDTVDTATFGGLSPQAVAGYTAGHWPTYFSMARLYPRLGSIGRVVSINIGASYRGKCLDVEPGDASPGEAPGWVRRDFSAGYKRPCVYANLSTMPSVKADLAGSGLHHCTSTSTFCYLLWDADWTFHDHLDAGYDCTQWSNNFLGRNIDPSRCALTFYGLAAPPPPPNLQHYENYPDVYWVLAGHRLRERNTVETWDKYRCENPVVRLVCRSTHYHLQLLLGRDRQVSARYTVAARNANHLPGRIAGIEARLRRPGVVTRWL